MLGSGGIKCLAPSPVKTYSRSHSSGLLGVTQNSAVVGLSICVGKGVVNVHAKDE